jgi:phosphatidylglycerophosphate synthase
MPPHPTVADVIRGYRAEKAQDEWYGEWGAAACYRPLAIRMTPIFVRISVPATAVTLTSLLLALSCVPIALSGSPAAPVAVPVVAIIAEVLDCVDGGIARATGTVSRTGQYLESLTDIVLRISMYAALGLIADATRAGPAFLAGYALALTIGAAFFSIVARLCRMQFEISTKVRARVPPVIEWRPKDYLVSFLRGLDPIMPVLMLVAYYLGLLGWFVVGLIAYTAADFLLTQVAIIRVLSKHTP